MTREEQLAWAAGFFDGEGSTSTNSQRTRGKERHKLQMSIDNTDHKSLTRFLIAVERGAIYDRKPREGRKRKWTWAAWGDDVRTVVDLLWPYLGNQKRRQAEIAFERVDTQPPLRSRRERALSAWETRRERYGSTGIRS